MRVKLWWFRLAACCLFLSLALTSFGQSQPQGGKPIHPHSGRIKVPWEFEVGGTKFPAGQYILDAITSSFGQIRSVDGKLQQTLYFVQTSEEPEKNPRAIFVVRGNKYYFSSVAGWFGKTQYTGFNPHGGDDTKEIPIVE